MMSSSNFNQNLPNLVVEAPTENMFFDFAMNGQRSPPINGANFNSNGTNQNGSILANGLPNTIEKKGRFKVTNIQGALTNVASTVCNAKSYFTSTL